MKREDISYIFVAFFAFIFIGVFISSFQEKQVLQQVAGTTNQCTNLPIQIPVLVLAYYPPSPTNPALLDSTETNIPNTTISSMQSHVSDMLQQNISFMDDATRYRGYKNPYALSFLHFSVYDTKEFFSKIPQGFKLWWSPFASRPNYGQILTNLNICNYVDNHGVKEVWMYGYHSNTIEPDESRMSGNYGDISNSLPHDESVPIQYRMPKCQNSYTLYNYNYTRDLATEVHDRMHQIENMISFAEGTNRWPPSLNPNNIAGSIFWGNFSIYVQNSTIPPTQTACGNTHFAPNWKNPTSDAYNYASTTPVSSNCQNWPLSQYENISCTAWGCSETGFYKWWMQNIPGYNNGITQNGQSMKNWWETMYDFNQFVSSTGHTLFGTSPVACNPTPTPIPSATPFPTSTPYPTFAYPSPTIYITYEPTPTPAPPPVIYNQSGQNKNTTSTNSNSPKTTNSYQFHYTTGSRPTPSEQDANSVFVYETPTPAPQSFMQQYKIPLSVAAGTIIGAIALVVLFGI